MEELRRRLEREIEAEEDSCRIYRLCEACAGAVRILGKGERYEAQDAIIV